MFAASLLHLAQKTEVRLDSNITNTHLQDSYSPWNGILFPPLVGSIAWKRRWIGSLDRRIKQIK